MSRVSLVAVMSDDMFLDALALGAVDGDDELARALVGWRRLVFAEPVPELVSVSEAVAVVRAAAERRVLVGRSWVSRGWAWVRSWRCERRA